MCLILNTRDYAIDSEAFAVAPAMDPNRNLTSTTKSVERGAFRRHGKAGVCVIKKSNCLMGFDIIRAAFDRQRALPSRGTEMFHIEALPNPLGPPKPIQAACREDNGLRLALLKLAQPRIDVAAKLNVLEIMTQISELGLTPWAAAAHSRSGRQIEERFEFHRDKGISRIGAFRKRRQSKLWSKRSRQVFQAMGRRDRFRLPPAPLQSL